MLPNTTHLNNLRKKTEGEGAPKHDPLKQLEKAIIEGDGATKHIPLIKFEKESREKSDPKHNPLKQLKKAKI